MLRRFTVAVLAAIAGLSVSHVALADEGLPGVWKNPKGSVHVSISNCGSGACGEVAWASAKAKADARKGGTENLVGLQLFRNFTPQKERVWKGRVFIPDLNATFTGTADLVGYDALKVRGCLLPNVLCKSQVWTRVENTTASLR